MRLDGVYADRLLLGILGTMSEAELYWLRNHLLGGKLARAEQGELRMRPLAGLVFEAVRRLVLIPDEEVQQAVRVAVRWQTEASTVVEVPRPPRSWEARRTPPAVVERVRILSADHTDGQIADCLNREGYQSGRGGTFTASKVQWIRYTQAIRSGCPNGPAACRQAKRGDGRCSAQTAAKALNLDASTIAAWCKAGRLDAIQTVPHGPWWIRLTPEIIAHLRKPVRRRWRKQSSR